MYNRSLTNTIENALSIDPPFILQVGDERSEIKERGRLEFSEDLTAIHDDDEPFGPPVPVLSTRQEIKFWIGDRLAFVGAGWGVNGFGQYFKPDAGLPEIHLDPNLVRAVT